MKTRLLFLCILLISISLTAQTTAYFKVAEHGTIDHLEKVSSGGYITTGQDSNYKAQIIRWDAQFNPVWKYKFTQAVLIGYPQKIVEANDGSFYYMTASQENTGCTFVAKFSSTGSIVWQKKYYLASGNMNSMALSKASGTDNGFLFGGGQCTLSNYIIKCNSSGDIEWQQQYLYPLATGVITCWSIIPDGSNYIVSSSYNINSLLTIKLDAGGNVLSHTAYTYSSMQIVPTRIVKLNSSGGYAILGNYNNSNDNKTEFVAIYNSALSLLSFNELTVTYTQFSLWDITVVNNGNNVVVNGSIMDGTDFRAVMINLSSTGSIQWKKMAEGNSSLSNKNVEFRGIAQFGSGTLHAGYGYNEGTVMAIIDANGNGLCNDITCNINNVHPTLTLQSQTVAMAASNALSATFTYSGTPAVSYTKEVVCGSLGAIDDFSGNNPIKISPNPATDFIRLSGYSGQSVQVSIFSLTGEQIFSSKITENNDEIYVGNLHAGYYLVRISGENGQNTISTLPLLKF